MNISILYIVGNLSDPAREQFYWNSPGVPFEGTPEVPTGGRDTEGKVLAPPDAFLLMLLHPETVKYLRLTDNFALTDKILDANDATSCSTWEEPQRVNP